MKQCTCCHEFKPLDGFSFCGSNRRYAACKKCRSTQQVAARRRRKGTNPTEWLLPHMGLREQLDCLKLRKWGGPVDRTRVLAWRIAA